MHKLAAIISQGDEIVLGQTLDTNSKWISEQLLARGIVVVEHVSLPDDLAAIRDSLVRLSGSVDLIICSGGLGPTDDDLTRAALAEAMSEPLVEDAEAVGQIERFFAGRGRPMPAINRVQALRPASARSIENRHGTAPGLAAKLGRADVFCLPGPPRELFPMFEAAVVPSLKPDPSRAIGVRVLHTIGMGESDIATLLGRTPDGNLMARDRSPLVGTTASGGIVSVRIRAEGSAAIAKLGETELLVRDALGTAIFADSGSPHDALPAAVVAKVRESGLSLAVCESCTAGLLGSMIGDVPGCSDVFVGGLVTYANEEKVKLAGVPKSLIEQHGAVSPQVAAAMATGTAARLNAAACLAITGVAGPTGGTATKPVGTVWISLHLAPTNGPAITDTRRFALTGDRRHIREFSAKLALAMLWNHLTGTPERVLLREVERVSDS